jgi:dihydroorotate dehydrogenase
LLQLYTGLVFEGPKLIGEIKQALVKAMQEAKADSLSALVGRDAARWTDRELRA